MRCQLIRNTNQENTMENSNVDPLLKSPSRNMVDTPQETKGAVLLNTVSNTVGNAIGNTVPARTNLVTELTTRYPNVWFWSGTLVIILLLWQVIQLKLRLSRLETLIYFILRPKGMV